MVSARAEMKLPGVAVALYEGGVWRGCGRGCVQRSRMSREWASAGESIFDDRRFLDGKIH